MATDISVTINPPAQFDLNLQPPNEIDLTISGVFQSMPKLMLQEEAIRSSPIIISMAL